ncbi:MAG: hypothetical protein ABW185_00465 [Sedimenticola sp.]
MTIQPQTYHVTRLEAITILWRPDNLTPGGDTCTPILETANTATSTTLPKKRKKKPLSRRGKKTRRQCSKTKQAPTTLSTSIYESTNAVFMFIIVFKQA